MKTKNILTQALGAVVLVFAGACNNLLELSPQTALSDATAYATPERIALTVAGMYDAAQSGFYAGGAVRGYPFGAAHVEQGDNRGEDVVNTQAFYLITYQTNWDGVSANQDYHFRTLFALINRVNVVLAGLETAKPVAGSLTQADIDAYKGECRFMRALAYHELLKHWCRPYTDNPTATNGGMPYRTTPVTGSVEANAAVKQDRGTVQEDYTQILADLDYAESVLPDTRASRSLTITRATKGAAIGLKTRIYQHMGNWAAVLTEGNKLVPAGGVSPALIGGFTLPANPYSAFGSTGSKNNTESLFSIENDATDNGSVNGALPSMYSTSAAPTSGRALVAISPILWNQTWWNATDTRKTSTFVSINIEATTGGGKGGFFTKKYTDVTARSDNAPVLRYAEVLLNMAEASQRIAGAAAPDLRAFQLYNAVRARSNAAGTDPNFDQISDFATGDALMTAILNERRIEFVCEGLRWGDLHRLAQDATFNTWGGGIPMKISSGVGNLKPLYTGNPATTTAFLATPGNRYDPFPYSSYKFLWPIPTSEVILNPTLAAQQNPGW